MSESRIMHGSMDGGYRSIASRTGGVAIGRSKMRLWGVEDVGEFPAI